jgi:hypothetical protein
MSVFSFLRSQSLLFLIALLANTATAQAPADEPGDSASWFHSTEDGQLDVSGFLDQTYGFLPVVIPITEPAVGYGAAGALAFIDRKESGRGAGFGRPDITIAGGLGTENGTRGWFASDMRHWRDDRIQSLLGAVKTSVYLDYYGTGEAGRVNHPPRTYALDVSGALALGRFRLADSPNWLGLGYVLANTSVKFDIPVDAPIPERNLRLGGVLASVSHDSRDNLFTPLRGYYLELSGAFMDQAFGSDLNASRYTLLGMQYFALHPQWYLALRESLSTNVGETPFYLQPFVMMRGVPAMRYQGEKVAQLETELRWQFWQRYSLVGFVGSGAAQDQLQQFTRSTVVTAGGAGLRYEIARKYGLHAGFDIAWGRDGSAVYIQVGSAWMRP